MDNVIPLWATPIYTNKIDTESYKHYLTNEVEMYKISNGWISKDKNILSNPKLKYLHDETLNQVKHYLTNVIGISKKYEDGFYFSSSWLVSHKTADWAQSHNHPNSLFSGCMYIDVDEGCGDFVLEKELFNMNYLPPTFQFDIDDWNVFNSKTWTIKPEKGLLLLFPSHIKHYVTENTTNMTRYSLSFNVFYKGVIGSSENRIEL